MKRGVTLFILLFLCSTAHAYDRVVSLSPGVTEIVYALDAEDKLVGVTDFCDYPLEAQEKESIGGYLNPHLEKLVSLEPDLVIVSKNGGAEDFVTKLKELGVDVLIVEFYTLADIRNSYILIGDALDANDQAAGLVVTLDSTMAHYREKLAHVQKKKVLFVRWHNPLTVAAAGSLEDEILALSGAVNAAEDAAIRYPTYTIEALLHNPPDVIIDASYYDTPTERGRARLREFWGAWPAITAVAHNEVYILKTDFHSVPGPRTHMLLDEVATMIHPDVCESNWGLHEKIDA